MEPMDLAGKSVEKIFYEANFIRDLDIRLEKVGAGTCETSLVVLERLRQQHGFVHGGWLRPWPTIPPEERPAPSLAHATF